MLNSSQPPKIVTPFANSAGAGYIRTVPVASQIGITNGAASFTDGFPPDCFIPSGAGGYPPDGRDVNYLLNIISAWTRWQNAGGSIVYDAAFSASIGGYPNGAVLVMANGGGFWQSTVDNNTSNPDTGGANWSIIALSEAASDLRYAALQCRLSLSGGNLVLSPFNGNRILIAGAMQAIPSAGVSLAPTGLTPSTLYYIYAYMNSGVMTLEASTTAHVTDSTTGVEIKSADATRTLVGMAYPVTGPAFADTPAQRFVRSWFNDPGIGCLSYFTANRATTSTSYVELGTEIRNYFLTWANEIPVIGGSGISTQTIAGFINSTAVGFDGIATLELGSYSAAYAQTNNSGMPYGTNLPKTGLSEGMHYCTLAGKVSGGTGTWSGGVISSTNVDACTLSVHIKK